MNIKAAWLGGVFGVIPGSSRKNHDTRSNAVGDDGSRQGRTTIVKYADDIIFGNPSRFGIMRVDVYRLATVDLCRSAGHTKIILTVQTMHWLVGIERERISGRPLTTDEFLLVEPRRVPKTVF